MMFTFSLLLFSGFECPDQHCSNLGNGYGCVLESDIDSATMECMFNPTNWLCNEDDPDSPCYCCKPKQNKCPDKDCTSLMGTDYSCVPKSLINATMVCEFNNPGYCNAHTFTHFSNYKEEDPCYCCKTQTTQQCPDKNCTTVMGKDYSCVPAEDINTIDMECNGQYGLCGDDSSITSITGTTTTNGGGCFCCKENKCPGVGCTTLGAEYSCVPQSQIDTTTLDCNYKNSTLCNHGLYSQDPCYCCKEKQCPDKGCSDYGEGYNCFSPGDVDLEIMDCAPNDGKGLRLCNDDLLSSKSPCRCCKFKQNCTDVGCSTEHPGYQCMNEIDAANYARPCLQHNTSLCASNEGIYSLVLN